MLERSNSHPVLRPYRACRWRALRAAASNLNARMVRPGIVFHESRLTHIRISPPVNTLYFQGKRGGATAFQSFHNQHNDRGLEDRSLPRIKTPMPMEGRYAPYYSVYARMAMWLKLRPTYAHREVDSVV
jgi:hypothetical protein